MQSLSLFETAEPTGETPEIRSRHRELIPLPDAELHYYPRFHDAARASSLLDWFQQQIPWRQDRIRIAGRLLDVPRLQAWYGDSGSGYGYSGISLEPLPWTPVLQEIRQELETCTGLKFNSVLLNLYRNGQDSVAWHSDDEAELGADPHIASLSYGAVRNLEIRPSGPRPGSKKVLSLESGSLLLMGTGFQRHWQHQIPKVRHLDGPRVNLTFRYIQTVA
jgi:alkylated DNA repair dioxygenase AlkB